MESDQEVIEGQEGKKVWNGTRELRGEVEGRKWMFFFIISVVGRSWWQRANTVS